MSSNSTLKTLIAILAIAGLTFAGAVTVTEYYFPSTGTIVETKAAIYLEGELIANGTTMDWHDMQRGETWAYNFTVQNTGTTTFNVTLEITGIPTGITYMWTANNTELTPGTYAKADLKLTVDSTATLGTYSMGTYHVLLKVA